VEKRVKSLTNTAAGNPKIEYALSEEAAYYKFLLHNEMTGIEKFIRIVCLIHSTKYTSGRDEKKNPMSVWACTGKHTAKSLSNICQCSLQSECKERKNIKIPFLGNPCV
jgi:hypothetical protein